MKSINAVFWVASKSQPAAAVMTVAMVAILIIIVLTMIMIPIMKTNNDIN